MSMIKYFSWKQLKILLYEVKSNNHHEETLDFDQIIGTQWKKN